MTTTVATAITAIRERLDEVTEAQWTTVSLRRWLNEAIRDIARRTFHYTDTDTIAISAGTGLYTAADDVLRINNVYFQPTADSTRKIPLTPRAWEAMDNIWWERQDQQSGDPVIFSVYGYAPTVKIKLYPVPSRAGTLHLHVARLPAVLDIAAGTGNVDAPDAWIEVAYDFVMYMALLKDHDDRWQVYKQFYEEKLGSMIVAGDYLNAPGEFIWEGTHPVPAWVADPDWY